MRLVVLLIGLSLSTAAVYAFGMLQDQKFFYLYSVLSILAIVLANGKLRKIWWYQPLWLVWNGASLLGAGWIEVHQGYKMSPVCGTFGPGFLIIAVLSILLPRWFNPHAVESQK